LWAKENPFFQICLIYFEIGKPSLSLSIAWINIFIKPNEYAVVVNRLFIYPLKQDVPHSSDLVLLLQGVAIFFYSVVAVPRSAVPFKLKAA
jgi:uncharacterized membrane protein SirB2